MQGTRLGDPIGLHQRHHIHARLRHERGEAAGEADEPAGVLGEGLEVGARLVIEAA